MSRPKLGLQWQAKGEAQKQSEQAIKAEVWATRSETGHTSSAAAAGAAIAAKQQIGRPRVIDPETTERLQVRIDRELVEDLRLHASREKMSLSQLVEKVVRDWKLKK